MNYSQLIQQHYAELTKSEKKVADYIVNHPEKIIYSTMSDVKERTQVGDATIIRFCQKLGFSGFADLKIAIAKEDFSQKRDLQKDQSSSARIAQDLISAITDTQRLVQEKTIQQAVTLVHDAQQIYLFGVGSSGQSADDLEKMFLRLGIHAKAVLDPHFQAQVASLLGPKDLVIAYSLSGKTKDTYDAIQIAKANQCPVVAITNYLLSPIAQAADIILQTAIEEHLLNGGSLAGRISQLYISDVLIQRYQETYEIDPLAIRETVLRSIMDKMIGN